HLFKSKLVYDSLVKNIKEVSEPHLQRIANKGNFTCKLQIATNNKIYTVDTVTSEACHYQFTINTETVLPLHSTASGKLVLAYLPEDKSTAFIKAMELTKFTEHTITDIDMLFETIRFIQKSDYATEFEETDVGISSIAVPIFRRKEFVGTLSVISPASILESNCQQVILDLIKAAHQISSKLY
ncbi:MAG: IclR family transcriptional regulator C-terminal domain-containing protein, partial [Oscillospiraceae bacterium]